MATVCLLHAANFCLFTANGNGKRKVFFLVSKRLTVMNDCCFRKLPVYVVYYDNCGICYFSEVKVVRDEGVMIDRMTGMIVMFV